MAADWDLLDEIYWFVKARFVEDAEKLKRGGHWEKAKSREGTLRAIQMMYAESKAAPWAGAKAVDYMREYATTYAEHPDFKPEWRIERWRLGQA